MAPEGKYLFGVAKVGQKGQIVIPKEAREVFSISPGDTLAVLGDINQGIGIVKVSDYEAFRKMLLGGEEK
ncbi:MAG: AbrB/MazE/SpoVT family DNA-binding domain-containing protein [Clostridiales bacterium]|jgi:AbrB family looped-hinge helix DNA binding protein|nr:AbrB/MazE/SpoVT family DNA-binding domain-containing protein [Clostridiales bacterium]